MTIVVVGDLMVDVVAALPGPLAHGSDTPARITHTQGGSGANVAAWLAAAGADVAFAGRAGADPLGDAAVAALTGVTVAVERDPERPTGTCIVLVHPGGERTMIPDAGANDALELRELPAGAHLHLTGYALLREASRADRAARAGARARAGDDRLGRPVVRRAAGRAPAFLGLGRGRRPAAPQRRRGARAHRRGRPERAARALGRSARPARSW